MIVEKNHVRSSLFICRAICSLKIFEYVRQNWVTQCVSLTGKKNAKELAVGEGQKQQFSYHLIQFAERLRRLVLQVRMQ